MKVYVLKGCWDYEGFEIVGIYESKAKAEAEARAIESENHVRVYDDVEVEEYEVNLG